MDFPVIPNPHALAVLLLTVLALIRESRHTIDYPDVGHPFCHSVRCVRPLNGNANMMIRNIYAPGVTSFIGVFIWILQQPL